jgi:hypothetical protein
MRACRGEEGGGGIGAQWEQRARGVQGRAAEREGQRACQDRQRTRPPLRIDWAGPHMTGRLVPCSTGTGRNSKGHPPACGVRLRQDPGSWPEARRAGVGTPGVSCGRAGPVKLESRASVT